MNDISALKSEITSEIEAANDLKALDDVRVTALGKKGRITIEFSSDKELERLLGVLRS